VIVMRDDFYSHLAADLPRLMNGWVVHSLVNVPSELDRADLVEIIRGPADAVGLVVEPELEAAMLGDAEAASPGGRIRSTLLPLIEFALTQLWRGQSDGILRESAYTEIGRVSGSLVRWADAAYASLDEPGKRAARRMFTLLTRLGDEASGTPPSRRRRRLDDVLGTAPAALSRQVLGAFVTARLLVVTGEGDGSTWIDIIHETLLTEWELLRSWLREDREFLNWRQGLEARLQFWDGHAEGDVDWLQGRELDRADAWLRARAADLDPLARQFIEGSLHARQQRLQAQAALERRAGEERAEAERQRQIAETRELVESLRADADAAEAMLAFDQARALSDIVAVTGANLDRLGGEPLLSVQSALFTVVHTAKERLRLDGHAQPVTALAIDRAGAWVVTGSRDRTVRLWPLAGGAPVTLGHHDDEVRAVVVSLDGRYIASGGADGVIRLWHPDGTPFAAPLDGPGDAVLALDVCPITGRRLAAGCGDGLYLWPDIGAAPAAVRFDERAGAVVSYVAGVAFSPLDGSLAVGCGNGHVWRVSEGERPVVLTNRDSFVTAVRYSPAGDLLAVAYGDGTLVLVPVADPTQLTNLGVRSANHGFVTSLAFTPDGTGLVYSDEDGMVHLIDLAGREIHPAQVAGDAVYAVAVSPDATWFAGAGGAQGRVWDWLPSTPPSAPAAVRPGVRVWDRHGCQAGPALAGHDFVAAVAFTASGDAIVSAGGDRTLRIWARDGTLREVVTGAHDGGITAVACSPAGFPLIASGGRDTMLRLFDLSGRPLGRPMAGHRNDVMAVAFSPDGALVASGSEDGTAQLWSLDGQPQGAPIHFDGSSVLGLAFSPDGRLLAATGGDGAVRLCDLQGTPQAPPFRGHESHNWDVAFAPDGDSVLSCGHDRSVRRWDLRGQPIGKPMRAHTGGVRAGRYHRNGKMIVTVGEDGSLRVWTAEGSQLIRPLAGESGPLFALALSPDGRLAATGGEDGTVRIWQLGDWRDWLHEGQARLAAHARYRPGDPR
jgi:WD40 repeat protein